MTILYYIIEKIFQSLVWLVKKNFNLSFHFTICNVFQVLFFIAWNLKSAVHVVPEDLCRDSNRRRRTIPRDRPSRLCESDYKTIMSNNINHIDDNKFIQNGNKNQIIEKNLSESCKEGKRKIKG